MSSLYSHYCMFVFFVFRSLLLSYWFHHGRVFISNNGKYELDVVSSKLQSRAAQDVTQRFPNWRLPNDKIFEPIHIRLEETGSDKPWVHDRERLGNAGRTYIKSNWIVVRLRFGALYDFFNYTSIIYYGYKDCRMDEPLKNI